MNMEDFSDHFGPILPPGPHPPRQMNDVRMVFELLHPIAHVAASSLGEKRENLGWFPAEAS
jgi:hypothetical protein